MVPFSYHNLEHGAEDLGVLRHAADVERPAEDRGVVVLIPHLDEDLGCVGCEEKSQKIRHVHLVKKKKNLTAFYLFIFFFVSASAIKYSFRKNVTGVASPSDGNSGYSMTHFHAAESGAHQTLVLNNEDSRLGGKVESLQSSKSVSSSLMCWWPSADQRLQKGTPRGPGSQAPFMTPG